MLVRAKCAPQLKRITYGEGRAGLDSGGGRCRAYARRHRLRRVTEEVMDAAIQGSGRRS